jgi:hypothetical protein
LSNRLACATGASSQSAARSAKRGGAALDHRKALFGTAQGRAGAEPVVCVWNWSCPGEGAPTAPGAGKQLAGREHASCHRELACAGRCRRPRPRPTAEWSSASGARRFSEGRAPELPRRPSRSGPYAVGRADAGGYSRVWSLPRPSASHPAVNLVMLPPAAGTNEQPRRGVPRLRAHAVFGPLSWRAEKRTVEVRNVEPEGRRLR